MANIPLNFVLGAQTGGFNAGILAGAKNLLSLKNIGIAATAALVKGFVEATKVAAKFEAAMSKLEAISGATETQLFKLGNQARTLGAKTASTASEIVELQTELAKLGFTTDEILNSTGGIRDLSDALESGLGESAKLVGSTLRQFGLDTSETARVVDVLTDATTKSALDFEKLNNSLKIAAPIANALGIPLENVVGLLGTMANAGIDASTSGTSLRKALIELNDAGLTLDEGLGLVRDSWDQVGTASELVGKRAATAFVVLANGTENTKELTTALENAEGAANKIAKIKLDNLEGDTKILKSAWEAFSIELGEVFLPVARTIVKTLTSLVNWMQSALVNIKTFFLSAANSFRELAKGMLEGIVRMREFFGLDTSKAREQIDKLNTKIDETNIKLSLLSGATTTATTPTTPGGAGGGRTQNRNTGSAINLGASGLQSLNTGGPTGSSDSPFASAFNLEAYDEVINKNKILTESFDDLASTIANTFAQSGNILKSFFGAAISGLVKYIAAKTAANAKVIALQKAGASADAVKAATDTAASVPGIGAFLLPALIGAALAAVGGAFSGIKGGGGGVSAGTSSVSAQKITPTSIQGNPGASGIELSTKVDGEDLRFVLQAAQDNYDALN